MIPLIMLCPEEELQYAESHCFDRNIAIIKNDSDIPDTEKEYSYFLGDLVPRLHTKDILFSQGEYLNLRNQLINGNSEFLKQLEILYFKAENMRHCKLQDIRIIFQFLFEQLWQDVLKEYPFFPLYFQKKDLQNLTKANVSRTEELYVLIKNLGTGFLEITGHCHISSSSELISKVCRYLWENVNTAIHLSQIAQQFYVNRSYLSHLFRHEMGKTFVEYYTEIRMFRGRTLLKQQYKVYECALLLGYKDTEYFSKVFKKYFGCKPTEYAERKYCTQ